jgi:hypothetical protein
MGLTIHWRLASTARTAKAVRAKITALRQACLDLPFAEVSEIVALDEAAIKAALADRQSPHRWMVIQSASYVDLGGGRSLTVYPNELFGLSTWPGEDCEEANFAIVRYPATVEYHEGTLVKSALRGWRGRSFCKTQYASRVSVPHFLACHLAVIAALDAAKALGLVESVTDESHYWEKRDVKALGSAVGEWNTMIAAFAGAMKDAAASDGGTIEAPITAFADFERLEHLGVQHAQTAETARRLAALAKTLVKAIALPAS